MRELVDGSKSLYLDIYHHGKRTYEPPRLYFIPEMSAADRKQNAMTMLAANKVKSQRIIELTTGEVGIKNTHKKVYLLDWMKTYMEAQKKRGKKDDRQIKTTINILKAYTNERMLLSTVDKGFCLGYLRYLQTDFNQIVELHADELLSHPELRVERRSPGESSSCQPVYQAGQV